MKHLLLVWGALMWGLMAYAQDNDPVVMTVNGVDVPRSEFEYSYNKNNSDAVVDRVGLEEYVDLFVNYKLKVAAALDEHFDTISALQKEIAEYRSQQAEQYLIDSTYIEEAARQVYAQTADRIGSDGLVQPAHILIRLAQDATADEQAAARERIDSIYDALKRGSDFAETARQLSQDPGTAPQGGELPWIQRGQTIPAFENAAFALQVGEMSEPVLSAVGYHIIKMNGRKQFEPYEYHKESIYKYLESRGINAAAKESMGKKLAAIYGTTPEEALARAEKELDDKYPDFKYLMKEYHDGSLLYEISNREVWDKGAKDEKGLEKYFKKHKKDYKYDEPHYSGIIVNCINKDVLKQVKKSLKKVEPKEWIPSIRANFNSDTLQVKIIRGPFTPGKNAFADYYGFKNTKTKPEPIEGFPAIAAIGEVQKKMPKTYEDVRGAVTSDYQTYLEQQWVKELRQRYSFTVYPEVLRTVNNHD